MRYCLTLLFCGLSLLFFGQGRRYHYWGIQPGVVYGASAPYYPIDELNFNIAPLHFQTPINRVLDLKIVSQATYRYPESFAIASGGLQVVLPRYFKAKERFSEKSVGGYLGPAISAQRDFYRNYYGLAAALECGKVFTGTGGLSATINLQIGGTYQLYLNKGNDILPYVGLNLGVGFWNKNAVAIRGGSI